MLVGASLGGLLAVRAAAALRPTRLVLVNPLPPRAIASAASTARRRSEAVVPWRREASLQSTARALPDADPTVWQFAWRRWRDESAAVLDDATTADALLPDHPGALVIVSGGDDDVAPDASRALARWLGAELLEFADASHVGPLLGRDAIVAAERVLAWAQLRS